MTARDAHTPHTEDREDASGRPIAGAGTTSDDVVVDAVPDQAPFNAATEAAQARRKRDWAWSEVHDPFDTPLTEIDPRASGDPVGIRPPAHEPAREPLPSRPEPHEPARDSLADKLAPPPPGRD